MPFSLQVRVKDFTVTHNAVTLVGVFFAALVIFSAEHRVCGM